MITQLLYIFFSLFNLFPTSIFSLLKIFVCWFGFVAEWDDVCRVSN